MEVFIQYLIRNTLENGSAWLGKVVTIFRRNDMGVGWEGLCLQSRFRSAKPFLSCCIQSHRSSLGPGASFDVGSLRKDLLIGEDRFSCCLESRTFL